MTEYFARKEYVYTGGDTIFSIPFSYIDKKHIKVYINDEKYTGFTYLNDTQIRIYQTLKIGDVVVVSRETPIDEKFVTFTDTSILSQKQQNLAQDQVFDAMQEVADRNTKFMIDAEAQAEEIAERFQGQIDTFKEDVNTELSAMDGRVTTNAENIQKHVEDVNEALHTASDSIDSKLAQAQTAANTAITKATAAATSASNAKTSETNAKTSETNVSTYKNNAQTYMNNAKTYQDNAKSYMDTAKTYRDNAETFKNNAATSASSSAAYAKTAREQAQLAKYYAEQEHGQSDVTHSELVVLNKNIKFPSYKIENDSIIHDTLLKMRHSTFDKSKFTVVGSPTITDDGVVSGFNSQSFLRFEQSLSGLVNVNYVWTYYNNGVPYAVPFALFMTPSNKTINPVVVSSSNILTLEGGVNGFKIKEGETYNLKLVTDLKTFSELYIDDRLISNKVLNYTEDYVYKIHIGTGKNNFPINGSIDLKQFSITVDGKEVFNGNKTGIDTIKADNYEVVGSPVISDDGVATFDTSSALSTGVLGLDGTKDWDIYFDFNNTGKETIPISTVGTGKYYLQIGCGRSNGVFLQIGNATGSTWGYNSQWIGNVLSTGLNKVHYKYKASESKYFIYINDMLKFSVVNANTVNNNYNMLIGNTTILSAPVTQGFDLNSLKIYQEGNLIYQPCLKIPYTQSKTGSKIVDGVYRDRVWDMNEQFGYTHYYTLGDTDFTLATCKGSDVVESGDNYEQTADLTLKQWGSCTSGSVVNLLPYKDTNYAVTAPYSAKTASSFTASATGDYIAIGKVVL